MYTRNASEVDAEGKTLQELLGDLDRRFPGIRFRMIDEQDKIRPHIKLFVDQDQVETLSVELEGAREVHVICALSGGKLGNCVEKEDVYSNECAEATACRR